MAKLTTPDWITIPLERYAESDRRGARRVRILRECAMLASSETGIRQATLNYLGLLGVMFAMVLFSSVTMRTKPIHGQVPQMTQWVWVPIALFIVLIATLSILTQAMIILRVSTVMRGSPAPQAFLARQAWSKLWGLTLFAMVSVLARMVRSGLLLIAWIPPARRLRHQGRLWEVRQTTYLGFACKTLEHGSARSAIERGVFIANARWGQGARGLPTLGRPLLLISLPLLILGGGLGLLGFRALGLVAALLGLAFSGLVLTVCLACYSIAISVFALGGLATFGFRAEDLDAAFQPGPDGLPELPNPQEGPKVM
ncbi:MAG: hypothetical protein WCO31_07085 [Actinomycetes bacterium]